MEATPSVRFPGATSGPAETASSSSLSSSKSIRAVTMEEEEGSVEEAEGSTVFDRDERERGRLEDGKERDDGWLMMTRF